MSEPIGLTAIALVVSFVALFIAVGQLLQSLSGTAEGFRRTNKEIMGIFAISRDRVFHWAELRFETIFVTPHFTFYSPYSESSLLSRVEDRDDREQKPSSKYVLAIANGGNRFDDLKFLIQSSTNLSALQRIFNRFDPSHGPSHGQTLLPRSQAFCASWLVLLEQLYEDEKKFSQRSEKSIYTYDRPGEKGTNFGPDRRKVLYPSIENHVRSWDLLPPEAVRPFASTTLGDLLTLCFRLRLVVQDLRPGHFSADGYGNNFASMQIQGLGMIVQYRYDPSQDEGNNPNCPGNTKFTPSENTDKLAFSIIPQNEKLGIHHDWPLDSWQSSQHVPDAMKSLYQQIGIPDQHLSEIKTHKDKSKCDVWRTFMDAVLLLVPFLPIDGLGIVKYQPPLPEEWLHSVLYVREARIVLRHLLNERLPGLQTSATSFASIPHLSKISFPSQLHWICSVFNFFEAKYRGCYYQIGKGFVPLIHANASETRAHDFLREVRSASNDADGYLASLFNQPQHSPTYIHLVAAHQEMAIKIHTEVNQEIRDNPKNKNEGHENRRTVPGFRVVSNTPAKEMHAGIMEILHRYIDRAFDGKIIIESYRAKTKELEDSWGRRAAPLSDEQIRAGWYTMMLRACLWTMVHMPICRPALPYQSRYWKNNTLVLIV